MIKRIIIIILLALGLLSPAHKYNHAPKHEHTTKAYWQIYK